MIKNINKLQQMIKEAGITQQELADQLEVKQPSVSRWLSGERQLPIKYFFSIMDIICLKTDKELVTVLNEFIKAENKNV